MITPWDKIRVLEDNSPIKEGSIRTVLFVEGNLLLTQGEDGWDDFLRMVKL